MAKIFVIMPAYHAEKTVQGVFRRIPEETRQRIDGYIVVNDGSSDDTSAQVEGLKSEFKNLTLIEHEVNKGYGGAEKTLLQAALDRGADTMVVLHADGQYAPEKMVEIFDEFEKEHADLVQGSRMLGGGALKGGMPFYKYLSNKMLTGLENLVLRMKMAEFHSGYMAYSRRFVESVPFQELSNSFDFDLEMIVFAKVSGARIREVAIPTRYADEVSHLNPIQYGFDVLTVLRKYLAGHYKRLYDQHQSNKS